MNIFEDISFNEDKPSVISISKTDRLNYLAVGLAKGQVLQKHKTLNPTVLAVLRGEIEFSIDNKEILLTEGDTYKIPVLIEHEVLGLDEENIFTLIQEK